MAVPPGGGQFVSAGNEPQLRWWSADGEKPSKRQGGHGGPVHQLAFSADGSRLISAGGDGSVRLWDGRTGSAQKTSSSAKKTSSSKQKAGAGSARKASTSSRQGAAGTQRGVSAFPKVTGYALAASFDVGNRAAAVPGELGELRLGVPSRAAVDGEFRT